MTMVVDQTQPTVSRKEITVEFQVHTQAHDSTYHYQDKSFLTKAEALAFIAKKQEEEAENDSKQRRRIIQKTIETTDIIL